jgi:hypothetical protein
MRFLAALALIIGVVAASILADDTAGPSAPAPTATTSVAAATRAPRAPRRVAPCRATELAVSLGGGSGVGLSNLATNVRLRNHGRTRCRLGGAVRVAWATGIHGREVGPAARPLHGTGGARRLTLRPGARAAASIDVVLGDGGLPVSECDPEPVTGLRVSPAGVRGALFLRLGNGARAGACSIATPEPQLAVGPLRPGSAGR